jgi:hypothetical protein
MSTAEVFVHSGIVITEKMDGESCTMYRDGIHARSINSNNHQSRDWVKGFHATICADIPDGWRICGENLWAKHSVEYQDLPSYFLGFSIWDERNFCLPWDHTLEWFQLLGIIPVPVVLIEYDLTSVEWLKEWGHHFMLRGLPREGYVVRYSGAFHFDDFSKSVGKFVRKNHVQTSEHWMYGGGGLEKNHLTNDTE